jgi:hypothetical protein
MLRDLVGDAALSAALRAYDPAADTARGLAPVSAASSAATSSSGQASGSGTFEKLLEKASTPRDLSWFFADWVDADDGLPDIAIDSVFPSSAQAGNWLVAINLSNAGYAAAEVPLTLSTADTSITQRVLVPARGKVVQRILILGKPTQVQVNDGTVPEIQASVHIKTLTDPDAPSSPTSQPALPQPAPPQQ